MLRLMRACSVFALLIPAAAGAQQTFELRCRGVHGGPQAFELRHETSRSAEGNIVVAMPFTASLRASGLDGSGLEPGTCSWIDRPLNSAEPRLLWFVVQEYPNPDHNNPLLAERVPSQGTISLYLYDAERYWSFFVFNTNKGHLRATSYRHWKPLRNRVLTSPQDRTVTRPPR